MVCSKNSSVYVFVNRGYLLKIVLFMKTAMDNIMFIKENTTTTRLDYLIIMCSLQQFPCNFPSDNISGYY